MKFGELLLVASILFFCIVLAGAVILWFDRLLKRKKKMKYDKTGKLIRDDDGEIHDLGEFPKLKDLPEVPSMDRAPSPMPWTDPGPGEHKENEKESVDKQ